MRPVLVILCILFFSKMVTCQTKPIFISGGGGLSLHGTGDLKGYSFFNQIDLPLSKRFFLSPGIQLTNHSQTYWASDFKLNYVTAGADVFTNINYLLLNKKRHRIFLGAGPLIRFQNSSYPEYAFANLQPSGERTLFVSYTKLRTTSLGYNVTPSYSFQFTKRIFLGAKLSYQNDQEGDVITNRSLFAGIKL